jgi:prolyl oligopeptidase
MESPRTITILWATAVLLALAAAALGRQEVTGIGTPAPVVTPPVAPQRLVTDDYFGTQVTDPYRYMEDATDPQVLAWIKAQDDFTRALLTRIPGRLRLIERIQHLDADPPANVTAVRRLPHERYFYEKALASDSVPKLYVRDTLAGAERMLVDPARYVKAGTQQASIGYYQPSFDGAYVITGVSAGGSENAILRVASTQYGRDTGDIIDRAQAAHP